MPRTSKKSSIKKSKKVHEMIDMKTENLVSDPKLTYAGSDSMTPGMRWGVFAVVVLIVAGIYLGSKGYIVAATVNGMPVFRWDVNREMTARFGQQTLENIISERLITDAAAKKNINISKEATAAKMNSIVKSLGPNVKLDDLLKYQGMTKNDFEKQIRLQLTVEGILGRDVAVSDSEISEFIVKNKDNMTATDEAALRGEAREALLSQKINEKIQPWFAELKKNAKIIRLMK